MTSAVIDAPRRARWTGAVDITAGDAAPYDASLRWVIRADAFLSAVLALIALASPVVALVPVAPGVAWGLGIGAIAAAVLLAALGAVTAVLLAIRMRAGHGHIPAGLRLPLPSAMRPDLGRPGNGTDRGETSSRDVRDRRS